MDMSEVVRECAAQMVEDDGNVTVARTLTGKPYVIRNAQRIQDTILRVEHAKYLKINELHNELVVKNEEIEALMKVYRLAEQIIAMVIVFMDITKQIIMSNPCKLRSLCSEFIEITQYLRDREMDTLIQNNAHTSICPMEDTCIHRNFNETIDLLSFTIADKIKRVINDAITRKKIDQIDIEDIRPIVVNELNHVLNSFKKV